MGIETPSLASSPRAFSPIAVAVAILLAILAAPDARAQFGGDTDLGVGPPNHFDTELRVKGTKAWLSYYSNAPGFAEPRLLMSKDAGKSWINETGFGDLNSISFDADGDIIAVIVNNTVGGHGGSGPDDLLLFLSQDEGETFTESEISTPSYWYWASPATVSVQGQRIDIFWGEGDPDANFAYYQQVSLDGGNTWLPTPRPSVLIDRDGFVADGTTFHSFRDADDPGIGYRQIEYRRSDDGGLTWSAPERIDAYPNDGVLGMEAAVHDGVLSIAWHELHDVPAGLDHSDAYYRRSTDGGLTFSPAFRLDTNFPEDSGYMGSFGFAANGQQLVASYTFNPNPGPNIFDLWVTTSDDAGATWSTPERLNPIASTLGRPMEHTRCMAAGDGLYVTWFDHKLGQQAGTGRQFVASWSFDGGTTWRNPVDLRTDSATISNDYLTAYDAEAGCVMTVWTDQRDSSTKFRSNGGCLSTVDAIACRTGNVNGGVGAPADVLRVNGSAGADAERVVMLGPSDSLEITLDRPPASSETGELPYVLYTHVGAPDPGTTRMLKAGVGGICMPNPFSKGLPQATDIFNTLGFESKLGESTRPTRPAPGTILRLPNGVGRTVVFFAQAIVPDPGAPNGIAAVTNGIEVHVQ